MPPPAKPAPVSGPGQLARRTDGGPAQALKNLPDAKYGEQKQFQSDQLGAPLAQVPNAPTPPPASGASPGPVAPEPQPPQTIPFSAPTNRPNEPVTAGAALGAGPGVEALGILPEQVAAKDNVKLSTYLPVFEFMANQPDSLRGSRMFVNLIKANQGPSGPTQGPGVFRTAQAGRPQ